MFGSTKCGKCEGASFKIQEMSPVGAAYKMYAVQCSACQTPIGVTDFYSVGTLVKAQEKKLAEMDQKLSHIQNSVSTLASALNSLRR